MQSALTETHLGTPKDTDMSAVYDVAIARERAFGQPYLLNSATLMIDMFHDCAI